MSERSWPTTEMWRTMYHGSLEQLQNMLAYLPKHDTEDQFVFLEELQKEIKRRENEQ